MKTRPGESQRPCSTPGCKGKALRELRFCGMCRNQVVKGMYESGYLTPPPAEDNWKRQKV